MGGFAWSAVSCGLLAVLAGCGHFTELESSAPSALGTGRPVAAYFDHSKLRVHGHTERDWIRSNAAEDPEYPSYWARVIATLQASFWRGYGDDGTLTWLAPGQHAAPGTLVMQVQVSRIRLSYYRVVLREPTEVDAVVRWHLDGRVTDAILVEAEAAGTAFQPTELSRIEAAAETAGETVREFVEERQGR